MENEENLDYPKITSPDCHTPEFSKSQNDLGPTLWFTQSTILLAHKYTNSINTFTVNIWKKHLTLVFYLQLLVEPAMFLAFKCSTYRQVPTNAVLRGQGWKGGTCISSTSSLTTASDESIKPWLAVGSFKCKCALSCYWRGFDNKLYHVHRICSNSRSCP